MVKDTINLYIETFEAARETIKNPDNKLDNLTWDNVGLQTLKRNQHQLSLIKPDNITSTDWKKALQINIVQKLKREKKKAEAKMTEAENNASNELLQTFLQNGATVEQATSAVKVIQDGQRESVQQKYDHELKMKEKTLEGEMMMEDKKKEVAIIDSLSKVYDNRTKIAFSLGSPDCRKLIVDGVDVDDDGENEGNLPVSVPVPVSSIEFSASASASASASGSASTSVNHSPKPKRRFRSSRQFSRCKKKNSKATRPASSAPCNFNLQQVSSPSPHANLQIGALGQGAFGTPSHQLAPDTSQLPPPSPPARIRPTPAPVASSSRFTYTKSVAAGASTTGGFSAASVTATAPPVQQYSSFGSTSSGIAAPAGSVAPSGGDSSSRASKRKASGNMHRSPSRTNGRLHQSSFGSAAPPDQQYPPVASGATSALPYGPVGIRPTPASVASSSRFRHGRAEAPWLTSTKSVAAGASTTGGFSAASGGDSSSRPSKRKASGGDSSARPSKRKASGNIHRSSSRTNGRPYQSPSSKPQEPVEADKIHAPFSPHSPLLFRRPPSSSCSLNALPLPIDVPDSPVRIHPFWCSSSEKQKTKEKKTAKENNNSSSSSSESENKSASNNKTGYNGCKDNNNKNNCNRNSNTSSTNGEYWSNDFTNDSGECGRGNDEEINKEKTWPLQALFFIINLSFLISSCLHALIVHLIMSMSQKKEPKNNDGNTFVKSKKSLKKKKKKTYPPVALKHHLSVFEMLDENGMINSDDKLSLKALGKVRRKLLLKYHPDRNPGSKDIASKNFSRINETWEHLEKALEDKNR